MADAVNMNASRKQFGVAIERLPAVAELVTDMKMDLCEAARTLTYETARVCDHENNNLRVLEFGGLTDQAEIKARKRKVASFIERLKSANVEQRLAALKELRAMGWQAQSAAAALVECLKDGDVRMRTGAAELLGEIGEPAMRTAAGGGLE